MKTIISILFVALCLIPMHSFGVEDRLKILVLDTGLHKNHLQEYKCEEGHSNYTGAPTTDRNGHGTNIIGLITKGIPSSKVCIVVFKIFDQYNPDFRLKAFQIFNSELSDWWMGYLLALKHALIIKPFAVNLSFSGHEPSYEERKLISKLIKSGVYVLAAAGNERTNLDNHCNTFPACYNFKSKYFISVGAKNTAFSNYGKVVKQVHDGNKQCYKTLCLSGTSQATANATNALIKSKLSE